MTERSPTADPATDPSAAAPPPLSADELDARVEAVLLTADRPLALAKVAEAVEAPGTGEVRQAVTRLNQHYESTTRSFRIEEVAGGYQVLTLPRFGPILANLHRSRSDARLSPAALETLAIVAYKQPILRADIEAIRGVACGEVLRSLMDRHLIKIAGRAEELGRPILYGTTKQFLEHFGLASTKDLPKPGELVERDVS